MEESLPKIFGSAAPAGGRRTCLGPPSSRDVPAQLDRASLGLFSFPVCRCLVRRNGVESQRQNSGYGTTVSPVLWISRASPLFLYAAFPNEEKDSTFQKILFFCASACLPRRSFVVLLEQRSKQIPGDSAMLHGVRIEAFVKRQFALCETVCEIAPGSLPGADGAND